MRGESSAVDPGRLVEAHRIAARFYRGLLLDPYVGWPREHLQSRGLGHVLVRSSRWEVGYAPAGWTVLVEHLRRRGFEVRELDASGLVTRTHRGTQIDRFWDRIVLPVRDADGRPVAFVGRARDDAGPGVPRYLNSPVSAIYRKGDVLLGLAEHNDRFHAGAVPVLVEGPTDLLAADAAIGRCHAPMAPVATCGTSLTTAQVTVLRSASSADVVVVATDGDRAGRRAAARAYGLLRPAFRQVLAPVFTGGADPADVLMSHGASALGNLLIRSGPLVRRLIEGEVADSAPVLDHLGGKLGVLRAIAPLIAELPRDDVAHEVRWLAERVRLDSDLVTRVIADAIAPTRLAATSRTTSGRERSSDRSIPQVLEA
jgi:DNA primase